MIPDVTLTVEQYDICWTDLNLGEHVYPLRILGHGRTYDERVQLRRRVYQQLGARRLARGERLEPELHDDLTLLARAPVWVDMHWLSEQDQAEMDRAVAARSGEHGLIARLDGDGLHLMRRRGTALLLALVDQLPTAAAALGQSITLPREALVPSQQAPASIYDTSPSTSARYRHQFRALDAVLSRPRLRGGQIVANARDRTGKRHRSRPVEWFDTEAGRWTARLLPATDGGEHLTVAPADNTRMATQVAELLDRMMR